MQYFKKELMEKLEKLLSDLKNDKSIIVVSNIAPLDKKISFSCQSVNEDSSEQYSFNIAINGLKIN